MLEADCRAEVKSDVLRSIVGFEILVKDAFDECWVCRGDGRGVRPCSGGSSTSAGTSSSAAMVGGVVLGVVCVVFMPAAPVLPMWSCSFTMFTRNVWGNYGCSVKMWRRSMSSSHALGASRRLNGKRGIEYVPEAWRAATESIWWREMRTRSITEYVDSAGGGGSGSGPQRTSCYNMENTMVEQDVKIGPKWNQVAAWAVKAGQAHVGRVAGVCDVGSSDAVATAARRLATGKAGGDAIGGCAGDAEGCVDGGAECFAGFRVCWRAAVP